MLEASLKMKWQGIINTGSYPLFFQMGCQLIPFPLTDADGVLVVDMAVGFCHRRRVNLVYFLEQCIILSRFFTPGLRPLLQIVQFNSQNSCLNGIQATIIANLMMVIFGLCAVHPQRAQGFGQGVVLGDDHACISIRSQVF